jgi:CheY-like chemotaxis protein
MRLPLNAIILGLEALQQVTPDLLSSKSETQDAIQCIFEASMVMGGVLNDVQTYQQIEEGLFELQEGALSLREAIECATRTFCHAALAKGIRFKCEISGEIPDKVAGDKLRIVQVFQNLISNAIKFNRPGERIIEINARVPEWHEGVESHRHRPRDSSAAVSVKFEFTVVDHGCGITQEEKMIIFEAFSLIQPGNFHSSVVARGSGLGLAIGKHIIKKMGGDIDFTSQVGEGSTFFFTVPFRVYPPPAPEIKPSTRIEQPVDVAVMAAVEASGSRTSTKDVLIVDDFSSIRKMLGKCVSGLGFQVHQASDGAEAVKACSLKDLPLVLMDNVMPNVCGVDACREIRAHEEAMHGERAFIIGMTGNTLSSEDMT